MSYREQVQTWLGAGYFVGAMADAAYRSDIFIGRLTGPRTLYPFEFSREWVNSGSTACGSARNNDPLMA